MVMCCWAVTAAYCTYPDAGMKGTAFWDWQGLAVQPGILNAIRNGKEAQHTVLASDERPPGRHSTPGRLLRLVTGTYAYVHICGHHACKVPSEVAATESLGATSRVYDRNRHGMYAQGKVTGLLRSWSHLPKHTKTLALLPIVFTKQRPLIDRQLVEPEP